MMIKTFFLILSITLISPSIQAKIGDTYICSMKKNIVISPNETHQKPLELFVFELNENEITFPMNKGYFASGNTDYLSYPMKFFNALPSELFYAVDYIGTHRIHILFDEGHLSFNYIQGNLVKVIMAKCEIK
jgi:hypothetical protein